MQHNEDMCFLDNVSTNFLNLKIIWSRNYLLNFRTKFIDLIASLYKDVSYVRGNYNLKLDALCFQGMEIFKIIKIVLSVYSLKTFLE